MRSLGRTCLLWSVLYLLLAAAIGALVYERYPDPRPAAIAGLASSFFLWMSIGYVAGIRTKGAEARQIRAAMAGQHLADGERGAVVGVVSGAMDFLESPITKKRCLVYEYKAVPTGNEQLAAWEGFALAPTTIQGPGGMVRILAAPDLEFDGEPIGSREHRQNFREYVAKTTFIEQTNIDIRRDLAHLKEINTDDDGRIRDDVHGMVRGDLGNMTLSEKTLAAGEKVVAFGRYSSARGGFVPDPESVLRSIRIVKGEPEAVLRKVARSRPVNLFMGCGCLLPVLIAAVVGIVSVPLPAIEERFPRKDPTWTEVRVEKKVRDAVAKAGLLPDTGTPILDLELGAARGKLTSRGVTSRWEHASAALEGEDVDVTLTGNAPPLTARFHKDGTLAALNVAGLAVPISDVTVEQMNVTDEEIRGRLTYLTPTNEPSLRVAFHASLAATE
jgi:hypothetical protein